ncbi:uncharacterized protein N0V89_011599 [Didymosphaeria variabile]|uniref:Homogentisate 1,2-dioxygenase n=1 Tax=Didymosphaeria variabile TaxID=1932322 RepID=A0A9W9C6J6_9PLEO|nr:uncharacterized protein N0V89_011599 [Didymosphaeria variabile]KAJ4345468.1 hypothetical protein N0V89_011599 [Didymosphaeria variabile]
MPEFKERQLVTDPQKAFHFTDLQRLKPTRENDPYEYQAGWGNRHQSELIPGTLPVAQNNPQEVRFGLYTEGITYSAFTAPRHANFSTYMYRCRPAAAHKGYVPIETKSNIQNCFLSINPTVEALPEQAEWHPFPLPKDEDKIDFVDGLHTLAGSGDPNIREGIALYVYMINSSMERRAFCNTDGDFLICAQLGSLDIVTEMGKIYLQPGEICVIQRGIRFCLNLAPDTKVARGYITEVWGSMWVLPDLGPLGGHGLANPRDFLYPVAAIDDELHVDWQIVNKTNGQLTAIVQDHSPFDLVAWHGNVVPYKYDLTKFSSQNSTSIDHTDPSIFCVLTAPSRDPVTPLADFLWFGPRWDVATNTFRLPYFHRNSASEFLACLYGQGLGRSDDFLPGGGSFEGGHTPHGGFHEGYQHGMRMHESVPEKILTDQLTIMVESSRLFLWTEYARTGCGTISTQGTDPKVWDALPDRFSANSKAKELLARLKEDKIAEKKRLAPYYIGGFSHGANASDTEGVHSKELKPYLNGTNGVRHDSVLAGPYCTQILADLGAEVIKIEHPTRGDDTRSWGPPDAPYTDGVERQFPGESAYYLSVNRNKKSLCLSFNNPSGISILHSLVQKCDILVENYLPGSLAKYKLDYETLSNINPSLIYASVTGYGQTGPFSNRAGYDVMVEAEMGLMHITGERDGPPVKVGVAVTDISTGMYTAIGVLAALYARRETGLGQWIDASLSDCQVAGLANIASSALISGKKDSGRWGTAHASVVPYRAYKTKDTNIAVGGCNDKLYGILCDKIGKPEWKTDARFITNALRVKNRDTLDRIIEDELKTKTTKEWLDVFEGSGMPYAAVNDIQGTINHEHVLARNMIEEVDHPSCGPIKLVNHPVKYSRAEPKIRTPPPMLGEHTSEVLRELLDLNEADIEDLKSQKTIA